MAKTIWYVYENLNDPSDKIVVAAGKAVASIYRRVAGPFSSKSEADKAAR
jgi:hypothetical protein